MDKPQLIVLKSEIENDPLGRGYSSMTDVEIASSLNTRNRSHDVESLSGQEMFYNTVSSEYGSLTDSKKTNGSGFVDLAKLTHLMKWLFLSLYIFSVVRAIPWRHCQPRGSRLFQGQKKAGYLL